MITMSGEWNLSSWFAKRSRYSISKNQTLSVYARAREPSQLFMELDTGALLGEHVTFHSPTMNAIVDMFL